MLNNKIAILGLGYVGLPLALAFGQKFNTIGFDINKNRVKELNNKIDSNLPSKKKFFNKPKKLFFSSSQKDLKNFNIFIITVPTPIKKNKIPDLSYIYSASRIVARSLKKNNLVMVVRKLSDSKILPRPSQIFIYDTNIDKGILVEDKELVSK